MKKRKKRYIPIPKSKKLYERQLRKAIAKRNWRLHHKRQNILRNNKCMNNVPIVIKFSDNLYLADKSEQLFYKIKLIRKADVFCLSFSGVKTVDVGSMLYIKAFVDFKKRSGCQIKISCSEKNKKMRQILQHMGLRDYGLSITYPDIKCWDIREWYGKAHDNYGKVLMKEILPKVLDGKFPSEKFSRIASGLHELLSNCSEHAYDDYDNFKGYYMIAGEYDNVIAGKSNKFSFCIIDIGQGFRKSLHKNSFVQKFVTNFGLLTDEQIIKDAVEGKYNADTSSNSGRGTGLPAVCRNVKNIKGVLHIYSDAGAYIFDSNKEHLRKMSNNIQGSIIVVDLPIN